MFDVVQVGDNPPLYALATNAVLRERIEADPEQSGWTRMVAAAIGSSTNHLLGTTLGGSLNATPVSDRASFTSGAQTLQNIHRHENAAANRWGNAVPSRGTAEDCQYQHDQFQQDVNERGWWRVQADIWALPGGGFDIVLGALGAARAVPGLGPNAGGGSTALARRAGGNAVRSIYADGTRVYEGQQPSRLPAYNQSFDPAAQGRPHSVLRWDQTNGRVYQAREYGPGAKKGTQLFFLLTARLRSVLRGTPYGSEVWVEKTAMRMGLQFTLRSRGRPRKKTDG